MLRELVADADVLVENFRPGVLENWGLAPDSLRELNPRLVVLRVTGFGQTGPYAERRAFGTLAEAMSGFAHQTGAEDGPPTLPPFGLADGVAGITGAYAVITALYHRDRPAATGQGQVIDLSLLEPLRRDPRPRPQRLRPTRHHRRPPRQPLPQQRPPQHLPHQRRPLGGHLRLRHLRRRTRHAPRRPRRPGRATLVRLRRRTRRNSDLLDDAVAKWIAARPLAEVTAEFDRVGAALAPIYDVEQLMADPHVQARDTFLTIDDEDLGPLKMQNLMFRMGAHPRRRSASPAADSARTTTPSTTTTSASTPNDSTELRDKGVI